MPTATPPRSASAASPAASSGTGRSRASSRASSPSLLWSGLAGMLGGVLGVAALAGCLFFLLQRGRLHLEPLLSSLRLTSFQLSSLQSASPPSTAQPNVPGSNAAEPESGPGGAQGATQTVPLEPMVVNLADPGGHAFVRLGLALAIDSSAGSAVPVGNGKGTASLPREREIPIRDTVLTVLSQQSSHALLEPGGRERLKQALEAALSAQHPDLRVRGVYFSELLVQP